ncbi:bifunctional 2-polyprenyl-6-hydroxyphenol methylase/3-demethylubiquinol 3-O-methyltransferase UbiG [Zophobihabitans entericus]|uniref:Ubiquinone biosynthesis O-methyltransferase n=1 Tax=Zophobihabitans entericus TaxID=1635327 RepID=A0A6G9ID71_9GAMM|nr:bifunctional 2-polyprenyl-6-hydroxyphenol methylase/3-demethylubiquinol 3-O-methyltransferase UbiG [Zophobihabitans entericus]QIQ21787.1 bifunctional 2-polyprenyl-6-hydroxyphenol methylase/3-demethylubiquinol 3-O-methyltransferase UbiG [Zophobihabitans entericus]
MSFNYSSTNIDQDEIAKFSAMAAEWWDPKGKFKPLHIINPLRLDYVLQKAGNLSGKQILDVGCGGGILTESLAKQGGIVTGLDMAEASLNIAKAHAAQNQLTIQYILQSVEEHAQNNPQKYDVITCMEMLEHVPSPESIIQACATLLKPDGHLFLSTINRNNKSRFMLIVGAEYIARLVPIGTHDFHKFIRPSEMMNWASQANLKTEEFIGIEYHLLKNEFSLSRNIDVNYIGHFIY